MPTHSKLSTCVFDTANEDIGPVSILSKTSQMLNNTAVKDCMEIEQDGHYSEIFHGKLRPCLSFWREIIFAPEFVLDIIENRMGTKFHLKLSPRHTQLKIALQPRVETVLFAKLFRNGCTWLCARSRAVARTLIGGWYIFIYSGSARLISFQINFISKETSRAETEYMNIHPRSPISVLATALARSCKLS